MTIPAEFIHDFKKSKEKNTIVQSLKSVIEKKLEQLIQSISIWLFKISKEERAGWMSEYYKRRR
jgi:hypothetical protein